MNDGTTIASASVLMDGDLTKSLKAARAGKTLQANEARILVDTYYTIQEHRKSAYNQVRSLREAGESAEVLEFFASTHEALERKIVSVLDAYTKEHEVGKWVRGIVGVGPVLAAGLLAYIDIEKAPTVGHIWRFAGLDPTTRWEKGQKRPWNARLKLLVWKLGESFVKQVNNPNDYYGKLYAERKAYEWRKNLQGEYGEQATEAITKRNFGSETLAFQWYSASYAVPPGTLYSGEVPSLPKAATPKELLKLREAIAAAIRSEDAAAAEQLQERFNQLQHNGQGVAMLPPAHIQARSKRYAVKAFLADLHHVWYETHYGTPPPLPYPLVFQGHAHLRVPPAHDCQP